MWECTYVNCMFSVQCLGDRAEFDVDASYVFPQGVLAALVGGVAGDRRARV